MDLIFMLGALILALGMADCHTDGGADQETTTPQHCRCESSCEASKFDLYKRDWCYTKNNCNKKWYDLNSWDYCRYLDSEKPSYSSSSWQSKHEQLWAKITEDVTTSEYQPLKILTQSVVTTFENEWDVHPKGRVQSIHSVGAICPFKIKISDDSPYTGLLKAGASVTGLARLSPATDPYEDGEGKDLTPGVAIKILRTKTTSANVVLLHSFDPLPNNNFNFFTPTLSNFMLSSTSGSLEGKVVGQKFCQVGVCKRKVGISHWTTHDQDGNRYDPPVFPFKLSFHPADVNFPKEAPESMAKFMKQFTQIPKGAKLYNMRAHSRPDDTEGALLGPLVVTDTCTTSYFGDTRLFFRHRPIEDDQKLKNLQEWTDAYQADCGLDECLISR